MSSLELSPPVFSILSGLIEEKAGLHYQPSDRELLRDKASVRAAEAGFDSLLDYYYFLRYDPAGEKEFTELVDALVVGETYFFREWPPVQMLVDTFIEPACAAGRRPRIWSAACASGEEPLSLAMLLDQRGLLGHVEIVASDISNRALSRAKQGKFSARALRQTPPSELVSRYLRSESGGGYSVPSRLIDSIRWQRRNLLSDEDTHKMGKFDAILCRNVLIYFSENTVRAVLARLSEAALPGAVLLVGVSESLLRFGSAFTGEERGGTFLYRKGPAL